MASLSEQGVHSDRIPRGDRDTDGERDFGRSQAVFPACQRSREAAVRPKILPHARWTTAQGWARCHAGASVSPLGLHCGRTPWENRVTERSQGFGRSRADFQQPVVASGQAGGPAGPLPRAGPGVTLEPRSPAGRPWETGAPSALWVSADLRPISSSLSSLPARRRGPRGHCPELGLVCGRGLSLHAGRPLRPKHPG